MPLEFYGGSVTRLRLSASGKSVDRGATVLPQSKLVGWGRTRCLGRASATGPCQYGMNIPERLVKSSKLLGCMPVELILYYIMCLSTLR